MCSYTHRKIFAKTKASPRTPTIFIITRIVLLFVVHLLLVQFDGIRVFETNLVMFSFSKLNSQVTIVKAVFSLKSNVLYQFKIVHFWTIFYLTVLVLRRLMLQSMKYQYKFGNEKNHQKLKYILQTHHTGLYYINITFDSISIRRAFLNEIQSTITWQTC